jgi:agmatine deiminase
MKEIVYISAFLRSAKNDRKELYGLDVYDALKSRKELDIIEIKNHQSNVWCRDYIPIKRADGRLVQFRYAPGYMTSSEKWKKCIPVSSNIHKEFGLFPISCDIILDGGAIEVFEDQAIISDRVFRDNNKMDIYQLLAEIKEKLQLKKVLVVPQYPYDFTGHVDGIARFIDKETVLINEDSLPDPEEKKKNPYRFKLLEQWYYSFLMVFENANLKVKTIPMTKFEYPDGIEHEGLYINFLKLEDLIIMPSYGQITKDTAAADILKEIYRREVIPIDARKLAPEGGMINCVTWNYW